MRRREATIRSARDGGSDAVGRSGARLLEPAPGRRLGPARAELPSLADERLVSLYLDSSRRDERLFVELLHRRQREVWRTCFRYFGHPEDADDMTQEVFFQVYRQLAQFRGDAAFRTWLRRIADNLCKNELRRRSRRPRAGAPAAGAPEIATAEPSPESRAVARDRSRHLARALARLGPEDRLLLERAASEQDSRAVLAQELGLSRGALKMRLLRIRLDLKKHLESEEKGTSR